MPETPIEHLEYTVNEWSGAFKDLLTDLNVKVCYDIGANAGGFSKVILSLYPKAKIVAVEPIKKTFEFLKEELKPHKCFNIAIYYGVEKTRMFWRGSNIGAYFTEETPAGDDKVYSGQDIDCTTLEKLPLTPDLVKMDVEGAEVNIIKNSSKLKKCKNIIVEWHPDQIDPYSFFEENLPNHFIKKNLENKQFLLCQKSQ